MSANARKIATLASVTLLVWVSTSGRFFFEKIYENVSLRIAPSAEKAFLYGSRHLDVKGEARRYDIRRAEYLFQQTIVLEPFYPYAHHQLARIAFLRGDFNLALSRIGVEIEHHGEKHHNAYYIKGLIEGYAGDYLSAVIDYQKYLSHNPRNWAAINDLAWVLLKDKQYDKTETVTTIGLSDFPDNPWLFNSRGIARFENGKYKEAQEDFQKASVLVQGVTNEAWSTAYPGNDPRVAGQGVETLTRSIRENLEKAMLRVNEKGD